MRLTNMIAYTSTMMNALPLARISQRGINRISPCHAPSHQQLAAVPRPHLPAKSGGLDGARRQQHIS
jgi:hypothetical protein